MIIQNIKRLFGVSVASLMVLQHWPISVRHLKSDFLVWKLLSTAVLNSGFFDGVDLRGKLCWISFDWLLIRSHDCQVAISPDDNNKI